jgi:carboxyl-terminal processing protease
MRGLQIAILAALLGITTSNATAPGHSASTYVSLFNAVWSTTDRHFYDPHFLGHDWKAIGNRFRTTLETVHSDREFERLANTMLDQLGASHLYVIPPSSSKAATVGIGVRFRDLSGTYVVRVVDDLSDAYAKGVRIGDRLLSPRADLSGPPGTLATVQVQSCGGAVRMLRVRREGTFWPPEHPGLAWYSVRTGLNRTIGYLRITRFDDGAAPLIDQAMAELKDTDGLIIDVRGNSGGNFSSARLVSYFSGPARIAAALFSRPYLEKLGHPVTESDVRDAPEVFGAYTDAKIFAAISKNGGGAAFMTEDLRNHEYTKPVVVLVDHETGSAGEGFAWMMKRMTHATLVGQETAGVLLSGQEFDLPDGWKLVVPVHGLWSSDGTDFRDRPVQPDIVLRRTRADLCSGRDPDVEQALLVLREP